MDFRNVVLTCTVFRPFFFFFCYFKKDYVEEAASRTVDLPPTIIYTKTSIDLAHAAKLREDHRRFVETELAALAMANKPEGGAAAPTRMQAATQVMKKACVLYCKANCFKTAR